MYILPLHSYIVALDDVLCAIASASGHEVQELIAEPIGGAPCLVLCTICDSSPEVRSCSQWCQLMSTPSCGKPAGTGPPDGLGLAHHGGGVGPCHGHSNVCGASC